MPGPMSEIPVAERTAQKPTIGEAAKGMGKALQQYLTHRVEASRLTKAGKTEVQPKLKSLQETRKSYEQMTARGSRADAATQEQAREQLANASRELVPVSLDPNVRLTGEEQKYVDAVTIAAADRVAASMPRDIGGGESPWRFGTSLERAQRYEEQNPRVFVRRTPDGLSVVVTTGNGQMDSNGQLAFNQPMPLEYKGTDAEQAKARAEAEEKARVTLREYTFAQGEPGTSTASTIQKMTYTDENGVTQTVAVPPTDSDAFSSVQRQVDRANVGVNSLYAQGGTVKLEGADRVVRDYAVRVVGEKPTEVNVVQTHAQRYIDNGNRPTTVRTVDATGTHAVSTVVLVEGSDQLKQRLYPANPNGIQIEGVVNPAQLNVEAAHIVATRTMEATTRVRELREAIVGRGFISLQDMESRITDPSDALAAVGNISPEDARTAIDGIKRSQEIALRGMTAADARTNAFDRIYSSLVANANPAGATLDRNQQNALWAAAEVLARGINAEYVPQLSALEQRARDVSASADGTPVQKMADITYLINRTNMSPEAKRLLIQSYSENAAGMPMPAFIEGLANMVRNHEVASIDDLGIDDPVIRGRVEAAISGEVLPQLSPEAALARLFGEQMREGEAPAAFRARVIDLANRMGITTGREAIVEAVMHTAGADAPARREGYRQLLDRVNRGEVELNDEVVDRLREGVTFSPSEWSAFNAIVDTVGEIAVSLESDTDLSDRLRQMGVTDDARRDILVQVMREMTRGTRNQEEADTMLENAGLTADRATELSPEQYLRYLDLTGANQEQVLNAVTGYLNAEPADLGRLRELTRRYPGMGRQIDNALVGAFVDARGLRDGETAEERNRRLTALAGQYASYASDAGALQERLLGLIPEVPTRENLLGMLDGLDDTQLAAIVGGAQQRLGRNRPGRGGGNR